MLVLTLSGQIGMPQGVHLLDAPVLVAQAGPSLLPQAPVPSEADVSAAQLQIDLDGLKRLRPGLGAPITLIIIGGAVSLVSLLYLALSTTLGGFAGGLNPILIIGVVGLAIGLPLAVIGTWLLINRLEDRGRIDTEMARLKRQLQERRLRERAPQQFMPPQTPGAPLMPLPQVRLGPEPSMLVAEF